MSMLSGKSRTFEKFGGTEESRSEKNYIFMSKFRIRLTRIGANPDCSKLYLGCTELDLGYTKLDLDCTNLDLGCTNLDLGCIKLDLGCMQLHLGCMQKQVHMKKCKFGSKNGLPEVLVGPKSIPWI